MAGVQAYDRESYRTDVLALRRRGWSASRIADELGMSRATVYRILAGK